MSPEFKCEYKITKYACYLGNMTQAAAANLTPLLFIAFRELYGISYTQLGLLVLVNFFTQLCVDIFFSFFSNRFNIPLTARLTPVIAFFGMILISLSPILFPNDVYFGLLLGTVISAAASGLVEVLVSPTVAAIPSDNPDREMSRLHSVYAWGVVLVVILSTVFLAVFGRNRWQLLYILWAVLPLLSAILFSIGKFPPVESGEKGQKVTGLMREPLFFLCFCGIFFGGASECCMAQWCSGFLEKSVMIGKTLGDILGVAAFGLFLGLGRSLYARYGKNIYKTLIIGALAAFVLYLTAALSSVSAVSLAACALTGFSVSMLWPGSLIAVQNDYKNGGVMMFSLMAAAGDLGGSVGPQLVGAVTDAALGSGFIVSLASRFGISAEAAALRCGILFAAVFPLAATVSFIVLKKMKAKKAAGMRV